MSKADLKVVASEKLTQLPDVSSSPYSLSISENINSTEKTGFAKFVDGFRRQESSEDTGKQLAKSLSMRHLVLMSMCTGIGTGLLVGTGKVLAHGGPLLVILGYAVSGTFVYCTLQDAGELAVAYSTLSGGYNIYPKKFISDNFAFATAWLYCIQWLCVIALELVTGAMTIQYWDEKTNPDAYVAVLFVVLLFINFLGARIYGEFEGLVGITKIIMLCGFIIMGICVNSGANPNHDHIGGRYWHDPGCATTFKGFCNVFVTSAFAFGQTEYIALAVAESNNPRAVPVACKMVVYKIIVFFLGSLTIVGLLVPYNSDRLMGASGGGSHASPYVLLASLHGVRVVPHLINAVILMSVTLVGLSALYASLRTLQALAENGYAPLFFNYIDKTGRPLRALIACSIVGIFSFIAAYNKQETVFTWLLSISGLSQVFTWFGICMSHIRFRAALKYHNIPVELLGYAAQTGIWGSYYAVFWYVLVVCAQFYVALFPFGGKPNAEDFFQNFLSAPIWIFFFFTRMLWTRNWRLWIPVEEIDIDTDRTMFDPEVLALEKQEEYERLHLSLGRKIRHFFFW